MWGVRMLLPGVCDKYELTHTAMPKLTVFDEYTANEPRDVAQLFTCLHL